MIYDKTTQIFIVFIINHKNTINTKYLVMFLWWRTNLLAKIARDFQMIGFLF
jgi:hypothetical protein